MSSILEIEVNKNAEKSYSEKKYSLTTVLLMLFSRIIMFALFQCVFYVIFKLFNYEQAWEQSANWWPFSVFFTNIVCVILLDKLLKKEGTRFKDFFIFKKGEILKNSLITLGFLVISLPLSFLPNMLLGSALFGDAQIASDLFFRPLPIGAAWLALFLFPLTMPLGELTTYFGYVMPRLQVISKSKLLATILPALMLSFQHVALPLLFDVRFMTWRLFMFLPFALLIGLLIQWKPKLLPYLLISHFFLDLSTAIFILLAAI